MKHRRKRVCDQEIKNLLHCRMLHIDATERANAVLGFPDPDRVVRKIAFFVPSSTFLPIAAAFLVQPLEPFRLKRSTRFWCQAELPALKQWPAVKPSIK